MTSDKTPTLVDRRGHSIVKEALANGGAVPVSCTSMWHEEMWRLDMREEQTVDVRFDGIPGHFVETAKVLVWLALLPGDGRKRRKANTLAHMSTEFRRVFGVLSALTFALTGRKEVGLDGIARGHFEAFRSAMLARAGQPDGPRRHAAERFFGCWALLGELRGEMKELGLPALDFDPLEGRSILSLAKPFPKGEAHGPSVAPDAVVGLLMASAEAFMERGDEVVDFQLRVLAAIERDGGDAGIGLCRTVRTYPWAPDADGRPARWSVCASWDVKNAIATAREVVTAMVGACLTMVFAEMGARPSELCSVRGGVDPATGLPNCIERLEVGAVSLFLLHGRVFKKRNDREGDPAVWTAGMIGTGSNALPPAVTALGILDRLCDPWRDPDAATCPLFVAFDSRRRAADRKAGPLSARISTARSRLFQFQARHVDWSRLRDDPECLAYVGGDRPFVTARMLRKTLVNYGMRLDGGLLGALRAELHHSYEDDTDEHYLTNDPKLFERARDFASLEVGRMMLERSGAAVAPRGGAEKALEPHLADVRAIMAATQPSEWLERSASIAADRLLATPRVPAALLPDDHVRLRGPALLDRYVASRRAVLDGARLGIVDGYRAIREQGERARAALEAMGLGVPTDHEIRTGLE